MTVNSPDSKPFHFIKVSADSKTVAVAQESAIHFYTFEGKLVASVSKAHIQIIGLDFSSDSQILLTVGDNLIKLWKNPNH